MKPIKSFIFLLAMILFYSYIVFFFKVFKLEDSFNYFHWILLLTINIAMVIISYYPIYFKLGTFTCYITFFTSLAYVGFLLSAILCAVQGASSSTTSLNREFIYLINLSMLLILLLVGCVAALLIAYYPQTLYWLFGLFSILVISQHLFILYLNLYCDLSMLFPIFTAMKMRLSTFMVLLYPLILLIAYLKSRKICKKELPQCNILALFICFGVIFMLYVTVLYSHHSISLNFLTVLFSLIVTFILGKSNLVVLHQYIKEKLGLHEKNATLMNKYYEKISYDHTLLHTQFHHMDSIYKQMLSFYPDAFFVILDFNICDTNEFGMNLLGASDKNTLLGADLLSFVPPIHHPKLRTLIKNLSLSDKKPINSDFELITTSGTLLYVEGSFILTDIYDAPSVLVSIRDLSFHKETYELERQIEMEKLKVEFFSTISHELRTPVNIIYSATQLQETLIKNNQIAELGTYTKMVNHNCLRLLRLLNNILDVSRLESNYFTVNAEIFNIVAVSESLLESIIPYAARKEITPLFDTDSEELYCQLDPELFERIILNLLSNAVKYGKTGGHIYMTLKSTENQVHLYIKDDGIGIPKEKINYIFNRFMRVENGLIRNAEGSGIGLSLVKSLVEKHNGSIHVSSQVDEGTEFVVSFPLIHPSTQYPGNYPPQINSSTIELEFSDVFHSQS